MHPPLKRSAGILLPAFSPRRQGDLGIGDTLALRQWIDWAADHDVGFIQLLPINENGVEESPYSPISSTALDPIYLTLETGEIPWLNERDIENARENLSELHPETGVEYPLVRQVKRGLLEQAWSKFDEAPADQAREFEIFKTKEADWLDDYCLFRFLMEQHGEHLSWDQWPDTCNTPVMARKHVEKLQSLDPETVACRVGFFAFIQWLCFRQWRGLRTHADSRGVKLMGDVPIGISWHSSDVFFNREEFHLDWCGGSPPEGMGQNDPFFQQWGQNWGIPLYRWDHMEANGFSWWKNRISRLTEIFRMFRLDHILGFYRIYAFPWRPERNHEFIGLSHAQAAALNGGRLPRWFLRPDDTIENKAANRADGDRRLRAILEAAGDADVIAEDLGWVPEYVRPNLADLEIAGFRIPHWDCNDQGHPTPGSQFPENSFATYSTHDHDPVCGIWRGCLRTIQQHHEHPSEASGWQAHGAHNSLRILSEFADIPIPSHGTWPPFTEGIRLRLIKSLFNSNARLVCLMVTSLFGLDDRINFPGTSGRHNWRFRLPWTFEDMMADTRVQEICRMLTNTVIITRRGNPRKIDSW